jgi:hypothetical protein
MAKSFLSACLGVLLLSGIFLCSAHLFPNGRMTGGGSFFQSVGRITHGFQLHCTASDGPNNLEVNWDGGNHFHLDTLDTAICDDENITTQPPDPPDAEFTNFYGTGTGSYNGKPGYHALWRFSDAGEPGTADQVYYLIIWDPTFTTAVLSSDGPAFLTFGNHQAHKQ